MFRTLAAILLLSSASAWAQSTQVAEDQKQLQGIWRVRRVIGSDEAKFQMLQVQLAFEGNQLLFVTDREPGSEFSYTLDPTKDPKQIDLVRTVHQIVVSGQKPPAPRRVIVRGIYSFEQDWLKLRYGPGGGPRPADFSMNGHWGNFDCVLIIERDSSRAARTKLQDARAILAIRGLGGGAWAFSNYALPGSRTTLYVKLDATKGDAILTKIAPQMKALSSVTGLHLNDSSVTDAGLASLEGIDNIGQIDLERTAITDAGLTHLRNMTHLGLLIVSATNVTEAGVAGLKKALPHLQVTHSSHAESASELAITNAGGAERFDANGKLIEILFTHRLSDFQLLGLQKHLEVWKTTLRAVDLTNCSITDRGLAALAGLTSLRQLTLKGTDVTVAGVKSLIRAVPDLKVTH
jgi:uncharacterized protein (TIGR03067 family)